MKKNIENKEKLLRHNSESSTKLHIVMHTKQYSLYSLFQHLLLAIAPLAFFLFLGFLESYPFITQMLARIVLILYIIVMLVVYLKTKKRDFFYMIIAFIIEFPILVFLAYFNQMVALLTLTVIGFLPWIYLRIGIIRSSSPTDSKKNIQANESQDESSIENNS